MSPQTKTQFQQTINALFQQAHQQGASDLHIAAGSAPLLRIHGELIELTQYGVLSPEQTEAMIFSILKPEEHTEFLKSKELDLSYELPGISRYRVNIHMERDHVGMVARVVSNHIPSMQELGFPEAAYRMVRGRQGLILVTGPTGSGKSTSMAAMINLLNQERRAHIITLEDPIEFIYQSENCLIRQRQLHSDFLNFPEGLKHVLRQDPDIIMVGEMRDLETISAAITVAETGHLVLATLHTISAADTIDRIVDVFPPHQQQQIRVQLSMELRGVISQQLIPRKSGGRIAAREIMMNTPAISNLIRENKISQIPTIIQTSGNIGMQTLDQEIRGLYERDEITEDVARSYMLHPTTLEHTEVHPQQSNKG